MRLRFLALLGVFCSLVAGHAQATDLNFAPCNAPGLCDSTSFWDPLNWSPNQTPDPTTTEILSGVGSPATLYLGTSSSGYPGANPATQKIDVQEGDYTLDGRSLSDLNDPTLRSALNLTANPLFNVGIHVGSNFGLADAKLTLFESEVLLAADARTDIIGNGGASSTLVVDQQSFAFAPSFRSLTAGIISVVGDNAHLVVRNNASVEARGISVAPLTGSAVTNSGIVVDGAGINDPDSVSLSTGYIDANGVDGTWLQVNNGRVTTTALNSINGPGNARIEVGAGGELDLLSQGDLSTSSSGSGTLTVAVQNGGLLALGSPNDQAVLDLGPNTTLDVSSGGQVKTSNFGGLTTVNLRGGPASSAARLLVHDPGSVVEGQSMSVEDPLAGISVFDGGLIRNGIIVLDAGALDVTNARIEGSSIYLDGNVAPARATFGAGSTLEGEVYLFGAGGSAGFEAGATANLSNTLHLFGSNSMATMQDPGTLVTATSVAIGGISIHNQPPNGWADYAADYNTPTSVALTNGAKLGVGNAYNNGPYFTYPTLALGTGGSLTLDATSSAFIGSAAPTFEPGKIILDAGGFLQGNGTINGSGLPGNVAVDMRGGTLQAGFSPGHLTINGGLVQTGGELIFEIGGTDPGVSYDVLEVLGSASFLGGVLKFVRVNDYAGDVGATLDFITGGGPLSFGPDLVIEDLTGLGLVFDPATGSAAITQNAVPEPTTLALVVVGCAGLAVRGRKR